MKKVIILQSQHFLKKNYTYNFFRSHVKFNKFFLKNNLFFFKFYKLFKYFLFVNFFIKKNIFFKKCNITYLPNNSIFLKKKFINNNCINLYGKNYIQTQFLNDNLIFNKNFIFNKNDSINNYIFVKYDYNFLYNYNILFNIIIVNNY